MSDDALRVPGDPAYAIKEYLAAQLPAVAGGTSPTFGMRVPGKWTKSAPAHVAVFDDGGPSRWPVSMVPTVRITVWGYGRDNARRLAGLALGLVLTRRVPGVATITEPSSILESGDTNHPDATLASFTVRAQARTIAV